MIPESTSDIELVNRVKNENDSAALAELTNRHSGIYVKIASKYSGVSDKISLEELKEDKQYNIYEWIIKYDETKGMKLGTYIGQRTKFMCLNMLNNTPDKVSLDEIPDTVSFTPVSPIVTTKQSAITDIQSKVNITNDKFWEIFKARHAGDKPKTWRQIGAEMGITHEWARQIYFRYLPKVQEKVKL